MKITDGLDSFFAEGVPALARVTGAPETDVRRILAAGLPRQLDALAEQAALPEGQAHLGEAVATLPAFTSVSGALAEPDGAENLEQAGILLTPALLGTDSDDLARATAQEAGADPGVSALLLHMALPLLLSRLGQRGLSSQNAAALSEVRGQPLALAALLGAGTVGVASLTPPIEAAGSAVVSPVVTPAQAASPVVPPVTVGSVAGPTVTTPPTRRRNFWWLLPLLLLLLVGGCWLLQRPPATGATDDTTASTTTTGNALTITSPAADTDLPSAPFTMTGTGAAGSTLSVLDGETEVGTTTVGTDGTWSTEVPAPAAGPHTFTVQSGGIRQAVNVTVAGDDTSGTDTGTSAGDDASTGDTAVTAGITEPQEGAALPAGAFELRGTGEAGQTLELLEGETSLGNITVGDDGQWAFTVPSPAAGPQTYTVRDTNGTAVGTLNVTVAAPEAGASAANCTETYTLSITDGQAVAQPFRFGGVGEGQGYSVTVRRGERVVGRKDIPLDSTCGWSYQSRPGPGAITYEVRPLGSPDAEPLSTVNLSVR
ncbi:hypothetical protein GO986_21720 [Deinococcus sp. HMF7620]|uniref:Bacterial Ig domain-containing protein n=1 Tax=Deinococcus arboris TaxID=2682977 RepID=A0A7C9LQ68_9DEIO|nr:DUF937 domain-containing protein [Deinococcus arboris]MVN89357.1 hypothetical protein [Deinococcus arboris]